MHGRLTTVHTLSLDIYYIEYFVLSILHCVTGIFTMITDNMFKCSYGTYITLT